LKAPGSGVGLKGMEAKFGERGSHPHLL